MRSIATFAFLSFAHAVFAQPACGLTLRGRVVDDHDGSPLEMAEVRFVEPGVMALTDDQGVFVLDGLCPGRHVLRVAHLFLSKHAEGKADRAAEAEALARRLREGGDWQALVAANSEDARSKARAGELGWVAVGRFPEPLWQAAARLSVGAVSGPVESPLGWHLLRLLERRPAGAVEAGDERAARADFEARRQALDTLRREAVVAGRVK